MRALVLTLMAGLIATAIDSGARAITIDATQTAVLIPGGLFGQPVVSQPDTFVAAPLDNLGTTTATTFDWTLLNGPDLAHATFVASAVTTGLHLVIKDSLSTLPGGTVVPNSVFDTFFVTGVWAPILLLDVPSGVANVDFLDYGVSSTQRESAMGCAGDGVCDVSSSNDLFSAVPHAVPEPPALGLFAGALVGALGLTRRRARRANRSARWAFTARAG
jgi:hypothetical protein